MPRSSGSGLIKRDLALRKQPVPKRGWRRRFQSRKIRTTRPAVPGAGSRRGSSQRSATRNTTVSAKARPRRSSQITAVFAKAYPGRRQRAFEALRSTGLVAARSASSSDSSRLFERNERSERSELRDGLRDRAPQGSRSAAETASTKRCRLPGCAFATPQPATRNPQPAIRNPQSATRNPRRRPGCRLPFLFEHQRIRIRALPTPPTRSSRPAVPAPRPAPAAA